MSGISKQKEMAIEFALPPTAAGDIKLHNIFSEVHQCTTMLSYTGSDFQTSNNLFFFLFLILKLISCLLFISPSSLETNMQFFCTNGQNFTRRKEERWYLNKQSYKECCLCGMKRWNLLLLENQFLSRSCKVLLRVNTFPPSCFNMLEVE